MNNLWHYLLAAMLSISIIVLNYTGTQSAFWQMLPFYIIAFSTYVLILKSVDTSKKLGFWLLLGVFLRFCQLFYFPNLSDDVYRFIWDGCLWLNGINPLEQLPSHYIEQNIDIQGINLELYQQLNSPNYYTIYPPIAQLNFVVACWLFPSSIIGSAFIMKFFLFIFECGSLFVISKLLKKWNLPLKNVLIYALNPLIIIEIIGNLHFEGAMIFFLLLSTLALTKEKWITSAIFMALSISSKLLPIMFLPLLIKRLGWKQSIFYFSIVAAVVVALFLPLFNKLAIQNFANSLDLYFRKFEFNASIYYIFRSIGFALKGYNMISFIGPITALCALSSILLFSFFEKKPNINSLPSAMLFAISIYLIFATTIHPWYLAMPLVLCTFTSFRFPIAWSGLVFFTYVNYSYPIYKENTWVVIIEYIIVIVFVLYELFFLMKSERLPQNHPKGNPPNQVIEDNR